MDVIDTLIGDKTVTPDELSRIIMPPKAVSERRRKGGGLTPEQSGRVIRVARIFAEATSSSRSMVFESRLPIYRVDEITLYSDLLCCALSLRDGARRRRISVSWR